MSQIVVSMFLSIDGVMENPMWSLDYWNDDIAAFKNEELFAADALLLGRVTYDGFVDSWPSRSGDPFTDRINSMPKYVASNTLNEPVWNSSVIKDVVAEVTERKRQTGGDLLVFGSGQLVETLMRHDLVDRFNLLIYPIVLGTGKRLFESDVTAKLKLTESKAHDNGALQLVYEPIRQ
jgi:dihydrofolate reductase